MLQDSSRLRRAHERDVTRARDCPFDMGVRQSLKVEHPWVEMLNLDWLREHAGMVHTLQIIKRPEQVRLFAFLRDHRQMSKRFDTIEACDAYVLETSVFEGTPVKRLWLLNTIEGRCYKRVDKHGKVL